MCYKSWKTHTPLHAWKKSSLGLFWRDEHLPRTLPMSSSMLTLFSSVPSTWPFEPWLRTNRMKASDWLWSTVLSARIMSRISWTSSVIARMQCVDNCHRASTITVANRNLLITTRVCNSSSRVCMSVCQTLTFEALFWISWQSDIFYTSVAKRF